MLDVFRSGTMQVEKRRVCTQYVQIKYFEASWPGALVAHRIEPLPGSMRAHTKKRPRSDHEVQQQVHDDVKQGSQNYASMLHNLMLAIQDYLLLSDDDNRRGALNSLELVKSTAQQRGDNRICIWLEPSMPCVHCGHWTGRFCGSTPLCSPCDKKYRAVASAAVSGDRQLWPRS